MGNLGHSLFQTEITFGAVDLDDYTIPPQEGETKFVGVAWSQVKSSIWDEAYHPFYNLWVEENGEYVAGSQGGIRPAPPDEGYETLPTEAMETVIAYIKRQPKYKNYGIRWEAVDPYEFPDHFTPLPIEDLDTPTDGDRSIFYPVGEEEVVEEVSGDPEPVVEEPIPEPVVDEEVIETTNDESKVKSDPVNPEMEALKKKLDEQESSYRQLLGMFISQEDEEEEESITEEPAIGEDKTYFEESPKLALVIITGTLGALSGLGYYLYNRYK